MYEQRVRAAAPRRGEQWEPVGELDPITGAWIEPPEPGWERRAQGWRPFDEMLRDR